MVVFSSDDYSDLHEQQIQQLRDLGFSEIILITNRTDIKGITCKPLLNSFSETLKSVLNELNVENAFLIGVDHFFVDRPNIPELYSTFLQNDDVQMKLSNKDMRYKRFTRYSVSLQPSLINVKHFSRLLLNGENPWQFEIWAWLRASKLGYSSSTIGGARFNPQGVLARGKVIEEECRHFQWLEDEGIVEARGICENRTKKGALIRYWNYITPFNQLVRSTIFTLCMK